MGRVRTIAAGEQMKSSAVAKHLLKCCASLCHFRSFMFGSSLRGVGVDLDILIVGPAGELLARLKYEMALAGRELPLDVLYMLPDEEAETKFIERAGCIPLSQLAID